MQKLERNDLIKLIEKKATEYDACYYYDKYSDDVQDMLQNLYEALWRFNFYDSQIIYIMNEALKAFRREK